MTFVLLVLAAKALRKGSYPSHVIGTSARLFE